MVFTVSNADSRSKRAQSQRLSTELTYSSRLVQASMGVYGRLWSIGSSGTQAPSNCGFTGFWDSPTAFFHIFNWFYPYLLYEGIATFWNFFFFFF